MKTASLIINLSFAAFLAVSVVSAFKDHTKDSKKSRCETVFDDVWEEKCKTLYKDKCDTIYISECAVTKSTECTTHFKEQCSFVLEEKCTDLKIPYCNIVFEERCRTVQECIHDTSTKECSFVPKKVCTQVRDVEAAVPVKEEIPEIPEVIEEIPEEEYQVPQASVTEQELSLPADGYDVREIVRRSIPESWQKALSFDYHKKDFSKKSKSFSKEHKVSTPVIFKTVCTETTEERCVKAPKKVCSNVEKCSKLPRKTCGFDFKKTCASLPSKKCVQVPKEVCVDVPNRSCADVPREKCVPVPEKSCKKLTVKRPREVCHQTTSQD